MRLFGKLLAAATIAVGFVAAAPVARAHYENTYFPLHVGNEWTYAETGFAPSPQKKVVKVDASWTSSVTGQAWFRTRGFNGDMHWLRQTPTGRIYEWQGRQWYRLGAGPGFPWTMSVNDDAAHGAIACSNGARLDVVSRSERVTVPAGTFPTIHIRFRTACFDAGITDEWFAQGVGLVKRSQQTIGGPREQVLERATIGGRQIGAQALAQTRTTVATEHAEYWENHMPMVGGGQRQGPEIKVDVVTRSSTGSDVTVNFVDPINIWDVTITDPNGRVIYANPKSRVMAPANGFDRVITASGLKATFAHPMPFGSPQGTYRVKARLLTRTGVQVAGESTFSYGWAY